MCHLHNKISFLMAGTNFFDRSYAKKCQKKCANCENVFYKKCLEFCSSQLLFYEKKLFVL